MRDRPWSARSASTPDPSEDDHEHGAGRLIDVLERSIVGITDFARDIQAQTRGARRGGEERLKQMWPDGFRHSGSVIGDGQFYSIRRLASAYRDAQARG